MFFYILLVLQSFAGILQVEILDIGQGDAILIRSPGGKNVLIDGGTGRGNSVYEHLQQRGIEQVNLMVGTHAHADHIGGLDEVIENLPVKMYMDNGMPHTTRTYNALMDLIEQKNIKYIQAKAGRKFNLDDGILLEILAPYDKLLSGTRSDLNSNSVILRLTHGKNCFLFTGDAEEPTEELLVQKGISQCDVLKVAHHGSNHSSSKHFLQAVQPKIALISLGKNNRYNHPGDETVRRLKKHGAQVFRTDELGSIHLESNKTDVKISTPSAQQQKQIKKTITKTTDSTPKPPVEEPKPPVEEKVHTPSANSAGGCNLNTASSAELQNIPGIGQSRADAIISHRQSNGMFTTVSQVRDVKGIGKKLTEKIAQHCFVE